MILGTGVDIIEVERVRNALDRHGDRFLEHVYSQEEQDAAPAGLGRYAYYAARWAAKEAVSKALGTGIGEDCGWKDVVVRRDPKGRPLVVLNGAAARCAARAGISRWHLSLSHERNLACAQAIAECC